MERSERVVAKLSHVLRHEISLGKIMPGEKLNIEALKRERKVSHPSVREALSLLVGEGYVEAEGNKGFRVSESSAEEQRDNTLVRAEMEALGFEWSVANATTDWRAAIVASHHVLTEIEPNMIQDPVANALEWDKRNRQFHFSLIANCGSPKLQNIIAALYDHSLPYRLMAHSNPTAIVDREAWVAQSSAEHSALKDAALASDAAGGKKILKAHIIKAIVEMPQTIRAIAQNSREID